MGETDSFHKMIAGVGEEWVQHGGVGAVHHQGRIL